MKIIIPDISSDLCRVAIRNGLKQLEVKRLSKVSLLVSASYNFGDIIRMIYSKTFKTNLVGIHLKNIDTSNALEEHSWMLIDYVGKKMFYNEGI